MNYSNNQHSLNFITRNFNSHIHLIRFLSYFLILAFGVTIGIITSFYLKNCNFSLQLTQLSLSTSSSSSSSSPLLIVTPKVYNSSINDNNHVGLKNFIEPSQVVHDFSDEELLWRASLSPKVYEYPFDRVPKLAFLFLVRGPVFLAPLWEKFFEGHEGYYNIYVHSNPSYNGSYVESPVFHGRRIPSKKVEWGKFNMIEAERRLLANALLDFSNERFILISESCIPLFNFSTIYSYLINSTQSYVEVYDSPSSVGRGRYRIKMSPQIKLRQWRKGSQWFEMGRKLALEVISDRTYSPIFENYCDGSCYADEHYLPTFVSIKFWERNSNRSLTWVDWSKGGPHPTKFVRPEITIEFLEKLRNQRCEYNNEIENSTNVCFLFARKFLPTSLTRLMRFAPKVMHL